MKRFTILTAAALSLIAMNTRAQLIPLDEWPWADFVVLELKEDPIDLFDLEVANANLHISLFQFYEPCIVAPEWTAEVQELVLELCDEYDQDPLGVDEHVVAAIESDIANAVEPFPFRGEDDR